MLDLSMSDEYKISVNLSKSEIARYNFHHIRWLLIIDVLGLAILLIGVYFSIYAGNSGTRNTLSALTFWGTLVLATGLSQPLILVLQIYLLKSPAVEEQMRPKQYLFDDQGIHIVSSGRSASTSWSNVIAIKDIGQMLLIYTNPKLAYIIPTRYFASREDRSRFIGQLLHRVKTAQNISLGK
jgi:hypothetical protein